MKNLVAGISNKLPLVLLGALILFAIAAVIDPSQRLSTLRIPGDRLTHGLLSYGLTLGFIAAFPKIPALFHGALVLSIGIGLEGLQGFGLFAGDAQKGDLVADGLGVLMALAPAVLGVRQGSSPPR